MSLSEIIVAEAYTAVAGNEIQADTTGGAFTITLPATASIGDMIGIEDAKLYWNTNNLTVARNGLNLNGGVLKRDRYAAVLNPSYGLPS